MDLFQEHLISGSEIEDGYSYNSRIEFTAEPEEDWEFVEWTGSITSTNNTARLC
ncbi:MAG: hypothetical protein U5K71_17015 [Gracilimonas sp.]|nr:hypothetical protein [Gracilimonas sp.]